MHNRSTVDLYGLAGWMGIVLGVLAVAGPYLLPFNFPVDGVFRLILGAGLLLLGLVIILQGRQAAQRTAERDQATAALEEQRRSELVVQERTAELERANELLALDNTERRRMEQVIREAAADARRRAMETEAVFNALSDAVLVYDPGGQVRQANAHAIALFGFDPLHFYRDTIINRLKPKTANEALVSLEDLPSSRALEGELLVNQRLTFTNPRGRSYIALVSASPMVLGKELTGAVEVWQDVTERERLLSQLSQERSREKARAAELEALMDAVPAAVWVAHDPYCRQVTGNQASYALLGLPSDADLSQNPLAGGSQGYYSIKKDGVELSPGQLPLQTVMREKSEMNDWEAELVLPDGSSRYILGNANPLLNEQGQVQGAIIAFVDVTDLKHAQTEVREYAEKLERSNTDLEQFASVASHDLQEPLRKVRFFSERLQEDLKGTLSEQDREYIDRMLNASQRMQVMISDLLAYSRVTTKARAFERVDLKQVAQEVVSDLEVRIRASHGQVEIGDLPVIDADPMQMRQLLQNLVSNGLKFHRPEADPVVQVMCQWVPAKQRTQKREEILLLVKDNGIGFDAQYIERIFKPFERLHGRSEFEGSGIGLAICKKIAERHQGTITAETTQNAGSTFIVRLPVRQEASESK